jgi:hypothetical protein
MEMALIVVIVGLAAGYLFRRIWTGAKSGGSCSCNCRCTGDQKGCQYMLVALPRVLCVLAVNSA